MTLIEQQIHVFRLKYRPNGRLLTHEAKRCIIGSTKTESFQNRSACNQGGSREVVKGERYEGDITADHERSSAQQPRRLPPVAAANSRPKVERRHSVTLFLCRVIVK